MWEILLVLINKISVLDLMFIYIIKEYLFILLFVLKNIVMIFFVEGFFLELLKIFIIWLKLKKFDLDKEILKNYRFLVNIFFLSKVIEKVVVI